ncbi:hypothetical protein M8C21_006700 [Ambrosia artemisiifolia]|uniref:Acyl-CoA oxidase C-terminal domain-containing protein n=1 Tax=Ambrosia artemisiifolia TaxID=4212 RepID=A0AAD5CLE7_AMBAR|nr:hypothetical protein M8C21_006700 [Ambrosia artemisiifolia]
MGRVASLMQNNCAVQTAEAWLNPGAILEAFESRAARMVVWCHRQLAKFENPEEVGFLNALPLARSAQNSNELAQFGPFCLLVGFGRHQAAAIQELSADLIEASVAHCQLIVVSKFIEKLQQDIPGKGVKQMIEVLCYIYSLFLLHKHQGDFMSIDYLTPKQASLANDQLRTLYSKVRPNVVALVDSFNYTDHYLGSILGCYDGNVYPKLYEFAWKDPLNESDVIDGFHEYVQPILKQKPLITKL